MNCTVILCIQIHGCDCPAFTVSFKRNRIVLLKCIGQFSKMFSGCHDIRFNGVEELTRELVVTFIDRIYIYENKRIKIDFNYRNELSNMQELLEQKAKEAIKDGA